MTIWLVLIILVIGIVWLLNKKERNSVQQPEVDFHEEDQSPDELIAVIVTAVTEFIELRPDEFRVLSIRQI